MKHFQLNLILIFVLCINVLQAQIPQTMNFQGVLKDNNGQPVTDTKFMEFRVYTNETGGTPIWTEQHLNVVITEGLFSVTLGETNPFPGTFFNSLGQPYITFVVGGEEMSPRQQFHTVPYSFWSSNSYEAHFADEASMAFWAVDSDKLDGKSSEDFVEQDASGNATISGTMTADSFEGDGSALTNLPPTPDSDWIESGNYVYTLNDSVGIGTSSPEAPLDVYGHIYQSGIGNSVFLGEEAGQNDDLTNNRNIFVGFQTGKANISGYWNNILGTQSFMKNETGRNNNAMGYRALYNNYDGGNNTAIGNSALYSNTSGENNIGLGYYAAYNNVSGENNISIGDRAQYNNTVGNQNIAIGLKTLFNNSDRSNLVAIGDSALYNNGVGASQSYEATKNTAIGSNSLFSNTIGCYNTATGYHSLYANTTGIYNTAIGTEALYSNTTGEVNTAAGAQALHANTIGMSNSAFGNRALYNNTTGDENTASGVLALGSNESGNGNSAHGYRCLQNNTTGNNNTAIGIQALNSNSTGNDNIAIGAKPLFNNTNGSSNIAIGNLALYENQGTSNNIAIGDSALYNTNETYETQSLAIGVASAKMGSGNRSTTIGYRTVAQNTDGYNLTAVGWKALEMNTSGEKNTAVGVTALSDNTTGERNTAMGVYALAHNTEGDNNSAFGSYSLNDCETGDGNSAFGDYALAYTTAYYNSAFGLSSSPYITTGAYNTSLGVSTLTSNKEGYYNTAVGFRAYYRPYGIWTNFENSTAIGFDAYISASNQIRIGNSSVTSIGGYTSWSNLSDVRFKKNIRENVPGLDFIMKLRPVTYNLDIEKLNNFQYKTDSIQSDPKIKGYADAKSNIVYTGFIAQEVEELASKLGYDFSGVDKPKNNEDHYSLRYAEFVVPLVKAVQEQQTVIEQQNEMIRKLTERVNKLEQK